ncbi:hypothetical protein GUY60_21245, partial [Streptomyces sp. YC537]|nr:hypothetical protein [Streptomyces boluensis]
MPPQPARRHRRAVTLLLGALLALLTLGPACGPANAGTGTTTESVRAAAPALSGPALSAPALSAPALSGPALDDGTGCGKKRDGQGGQPVAPSRGTAHEQLASTLSYEHGSTGDWTADGDPAGVTPD